MQLINDIQIFQFGSSVNSEDYDDIDLLIRYKELKVEKIILLLEFKNKLKRILNTKYGCYIDIIMLSNQEVSEKNFLNIMTWKKIYG